MPHLEKTLNSLEIIKPDDWHLHLRSGAALKSVIGMSARQMGRAIIMPNLTPPASTLARIISYKKEIIKALPADTDFTPLMTLYLTDKTTPLDIKEASKNQVIGAKFYPQGATTNAQDGVSNIKAIYPALQMMQKLGMPLLLHGEVMRQDVDIFDREAVFIDEVLLKITADFPNLKIVFEHITTQQAVDFVTASPANIAATITPHHLLANRNDMLGNGIKPHYFCLPILKRKNPHQTALLNAAASGNPKFFLGTDSAPHAITDKQSACGCAGIFNAFAAIELYATAFEAENALDKLEDFASKFGPDFYNLAHNKSSIILQKQPHTIPKSYPLGNSSVVPFMAGQTLRWKQITENK